MLKQLVYSTAKLAYRMSTLGMRRGDHVTRFFMYRHLSQYAEQREGNSQVLSVSHSERLARVLGFTDQQITDASYPMYNVLDLPFDDDSFDAVVSDQVLEHIEGDPYLAFEELFRILKPNGIALHATCFVYPIHGAPSDFWRFTPNALKLLASPYADILESGGWGNPYVWPFVAMGLRFEPIPECRRHPAHWLATYNNPEWPISTWVLARKKN